MLSELRSNGSHFTWSNKQKEGSRIFSKLDRCFINEKWIDALPDSEVRINWDTISYHCFCIIKTVLFQVSGIRPFRFFNMWAKHKDFRNEVLSLWAKPTGGSGLFQISQKLRRIKPVLSEFNQKQIGDIIVQLYAAAKLNYEKAQLLLQQSPESIILLQEEQEAHDEFVSKSKMYESFLRQKSKINWLRFGDENTAFFHASLKQRRIRNRITYFLNEEGQMIDNNEEVVSHFFNHFKGFLGKGSITISRADRTCFQQGCVLNLEQQLDLIQPFSKKDVKRTLFSISSIKSPGPNGFGSGFYKALWKDLGDDITEAILLFFEQGVISVELNSTILSLIPKVDTPVSAGDYRPIACGNTLYKCVSKMLCFSFAGRKGLRQGDPISPLLFVLVMEYLTRLLNQVVQHREFRFHPMCKNLHLVNLCFADDMILFWRFPLKYLGVSLKPTRWQVADCSEIIKKLQARLHVWASRHLSFAGRTQLIFSVLLGIRNYWMQIFMLPTSVIQEIDRIFRNFLWGANGHRSKFHCSSWSQVCLPKSLGGVGFKEGSNWNKVLLAKSIWAVSSKQDVFWVKWIDAIYLRGQSFWSYQLKPDVSWYWRKPCYLREEFSEANLVNSVVHGKLSLKTLYLNWLQRVSVDVAKAVWSRLTVPKHRFILWQSILGHLLTRDNLIKCQILVNSCLCPVCERAEESRQHLFFDCSFSHQLWSMESGVTKILAIFLIVPALLFV
ncbi:uncharacterized protein LOC133792073 [Humulus lupulus]|uniref:uncharacterized protein LOC133792073 n=1 Tax=Humulus lupulus TaxID=3486 RepID=UPI002B40D9F0|nr:uncharacterized protein LOC133792073 [Humulus lupulus]